MRRRSLLRCVAAASVVAVTPPAMAALAIGPCQEVDDREEVGTCEHCEKQLYEGDKGFWYDDGPMFCETCSPTWNELKAEQDEGIRAGDFKDWFEEPEDADVARESVLAHIAAGDGDKRVLSSL